MTAIFNRWLPGITLAIWSSVLLAFSLGGRLSWFLAPGYRPLVLPAGLVLLVMAIVFLVFPADAACCRSGVCGHPLSRYNTGKWLTFLILIVPLAIAARFTPAGFSRNAMENRGVATDAAQVGALMSKVKAKADAITSAPAANAPAPAPAPAQDTAAKSSDPLALPLPQAEPATSTAAAPATAPGAAAPAPAAAATTEAPSLDSYVQKTPEGYLEAEVLDLLYAAQDNTLRKVFEGKTVQLIGQLMPDPADTAGGPGGHRFKAVRMFMTCCAADARPVATAIEAPELPKLPEMTWVKIIGKATFPIENGRRAALLAAEKVEKVEPPAESMLY